MKGAFFQLWLLDPRGSGSTGFQFTEGRSGFRNGRGEAMKYCTAFVGLPYASQHAVRTCKSLYMLKIKDWHVL